jgi:hypothetical protein
MDRRRFLKSLAATGLVANLVGSKPLLADDEDFADKLITEPKTEFIFARVFYRGGDWNTDMLHRGLKGGAEINLLKRVLEETDIRTTPGENVVKLNRTIAFQSPFLYMTGHGRIETSRTEEQNLRKALESGAFLFAESCGGRGLGFDSDFRSLVQRVLPGRSLEKLPMEHALYRCFFQIDKILGGDKLAADFMEGIEIDGRLAVLYTMNDLGCAWEGHPCGPGGEAQRDHAFRLGINIIVYSMTH